MDNPNHRGQCAIELIVICLVLTVVVVLFTRFEEASRTTFRPAQLSEERK